MHLYGRLIDEPTRLRLLITVPSLLKRIGKVNRKFRLPTRASGQTDGVVVTAVARERSHM